MNSVVPKKRPSSPGDDSPSPARRGWLPQWLFSWEVYLIILLAGFLRFYLINRTELDDDQAMLFRLAQDAIHHGLLPTTSNAASIGIANPPGVIFLFMPLALFGNNPILGAILISTFTTLAAVLTYLFTRRYYGRMAGIIAALLYATAAKPLNYARFIWQPNLMPPFVVLFFFALFFGVVERRKGWLLPALLLFGVLYQMHPTTILLAAPLGVAFILSPGTFRWRDVGFALLGLLIIFSPYLLWEISTHFADIRTLFTLAKQHAHIDGQAIRFYLYFLSPYDHAPTYPTSVVRALVPLLSWLRYIVPLLTAAGFVLAGLLLLRPVLATTDDSKGPHRPSSPFVQWWNAFRADPYRCGLVVLLIWQLVPLAVLSRHAVDLHAQYFFMLLPGPFILIGLFCSKLVEWAEETFRIAPDKSGAGAINPGPTTPLIWISKGMRYAVLLLVFLVVATQFIGSTAAVVDSTSGNYDDRSFQPYPYHNDLESLQRALSMADQLAQSRHLNHVYVTTDAATQTALRYLAEQMHTPTTLFDAVHCLALPNLTDGPAVMLIGPYDGLPNALLNQFADAQLVAKPARLGGPPFQLYTVTPKAAQPATTETLSNQLQQLDARATTVQANDTSWLATRWSMLRTVQPAFRTTYSYAMTAQLDATHTQLSVCTFTALRAGDQMVVAFHIPPDIGALSSMTVQAQTFTTTPYNPTYGPFHLETDQYQSTPWANLTTVDGKKGVVIAV